MSIALHIQADEWTKNQSIKNDEWTTVWTTEVVTYKSKFHNAIWELSSPNVRVRLSYNEQVAFDLSLYELQSDYKLSLPHQPAGEFILTEYHSPNRWILKPPEPFYTDVGSEIKIEMKSIKNKTYQVVRGITVWGQP